MFSVIKTAFNHFSYFNWILTFKFFLLGAKLGTSLKNVRRVTLLDRTQKARVHSLIKCTTVLLHKRIKYYYMCSSWGKTDLYQTGLRSWMWLRDQILSQQLQQSDYLVSFTTKNQPSRIYRTRHDKVKTFSWHYFPPVLIYCQLTSILCQK